MLHQQRQARKKNMDFAIGTWLAICYTILILPRPGQPWPYYTLLNKFGQGQQKRPASLLLTHGRPNPKDLMYIKARCRARMFS